MSEYCKRPASDQAPADDFVTAYDKAHLKLYVRLLDAESAGASLAEVAPVLLGIDADSEPERARRVYDSHLGRAHWMTEHGYRDLLRRGLPPDGG